jgi:hypothetical protein
MSESGGWNRREFIKRTAAVGIGVGVGLELRAAAAETKNEMPMRSLGRTG